MQYLIGDLFVAASQWGMLVIVANLLELEDLGYFTYFLAIIAPLSYLIQMQHRVVYVTDGFPEFNLYDYIISRMILFMIAICTSGLFIFEYQKDAFDIFLLLFIWKFIEMIDDLVYGYWQKNMAIEKISKSKVIRSIVQISLFAVFSFITSSLEFSLFVMILFTIFWLFYNLNKVELDRKISINAENFFNLVKITYPLAIYSSLAILYSNIPKYFIELELGIDEVAIFSTLAYFLVIGNLLINSMVQVKLTFLSGLYMSSNIKKIYKELLTIILLLCTFSFISIFITIIWGEDLLNFVYNEKIAEHTGLLVLLFIASIFSYSSSVLGMILTIAKGYKLQAYLSIVWCFIYIGFSIFCIDRYGLIGSGYAYVMSSIVQLISLIIAIKFYLHRKKYNFGK
ncbi:lipopolysaccharide biosynthesis protein [Exiguobacterium sp. s59]|uniref:lipopolysaccharide biosynthesis protein n=1 Tax=Exiguobacterium sp. s59 TaxID=2751269 RepID=UPI001BEA5D6D|nr:hypothetical protein [Exiguobacterium sp. s59]